MGRTIHLILIMALLAAGGCGREEKRLRMATTTSVVDSGLLDELLPRFEQSTGIRIDVIAVGSGKALKLLENGDVDCTITHSRKDEEALVAKGIADRRREIMFNFFLVVGPASDPVGLKSAKNVDEAFRKIAAGGSGFLSRGDSSGTHVREREIWKRIGLGPAGKPWYLESGTGMGETLEIALQKGYYTLTDQGTLVAYKNSDGLARHVESDPSLLNVYAHMTTKNSSRRAEADVLGEWLTSPEGQRLIGGYQKRGVAAFNPIANIR